MANIVTKLEYTLNVSNFIKMIMRLFIIENESHYHFLYMILNLIIKFTVLLLMLTNILLLILFMLFVKLSRLCEIQSKH